MAASICATSASPELVAGSIICTFTCLPLAAESSWPARVAPLRLASKKVFVASLDIHAMVMGSAGASALAEHPAATATRITHGAMAIRVLVENLDDLDFGAMIRCNDGTPLD